MMFSSLPSYGFSDEYIPKNMPKPKPADFEQPVVTAVIISFNTQSHIAGCIESLLEQDYPFLEIILIDNNSGDNSVATALGFDKQVKVMANWTNKGFAGAANQGISLANPDGLVFIMNPDIRLAPDHISQAVKTMMTSEDIASVQGRLYRLQVNESKQSAFVENEFLDTVQTEIIQPVRDENNYPIVDTLGHNPHRNRVFRNRYEGQSFDGTFGTQDEDIWGVSGCAALYRISALKDIAIEGEIFDEDFFAFFEDVDVDWRLKARGWRSRYSANAIGLHERGGNGSRRSSFVERLSFRNWFLLMAKNDDWVSVGKDSPLIGVTSILITADIAITVPIAFVAAVGDTRLLKKILHKRILMQERAKVTNPELVEQWFGTFDFRNWIERRLRRSKLARFFS